MTRSKDCRPEVSSWSRATSTRSWWRTITSTGVRLADGRIVACRAVAVTPTFAARAGVLVALGLEATDHPSAMGTYVSSDFTGATAVPGVWVAGNVTDPMAQVGASAAAGALAGAAINADLVAEDVQLAIGHVPRG